MDVFWGLHLNYNGVNTKLELVTRQGGRQRHQSNAGKRRPFTMRSVIGRFGKWYFRFKKLNEYGQSKTAFEA